MMVTITRTDLQRKWFAQPITVRSVWKDIEMASSFTRIRKRIIPLYKKGEVELGYFNSAITDSGKFVSWHPNRINVQTYNFSDVPYDEAKITMDNVHPGPPYRNGGPFRTLKLKWSSPYYGVHGIGTYVRNDGLQRYVGGFGPPTNNQFLTSSGLYDLSVVLIENSPAFPSMSGLGDKGYSRTKPKLEQASAFVFAREGGDTPRMLKTTAKGFSDIWKLMGGSTSSRIMDPKKIADQFLNQQFGWKPFLSDLRKFDDVIQNSARYIENISNRNGLWTRKRVTLEDVSTDVRIASGTGVSLAPVLPGEYFSSQPTWEVREITRSHAYAVGKFYYYNPAFDKSLADNLSGWNHAMRAITLAGARPTPSNVYKSIPWTWAIDWVSNVGLHVDFISDMLVDSVACQYLYVMKTETKIRRYIQYLPFPSRPLTLTFDRFTESKQRQEGTGPYGFSLSWDDLTPRQLAIAAALGISRK